MTVMGLWLTILSSQALCQGGSTVDLQRQTLMTLLQDEKAKTTQVQAQLTALRAAQERAKQELIQAQSALSQILTVRQEARLVIEGLLN